MEEFLILNFFLLYVCINIIINDIYKIIGNRNFTANYSSVRIFELEIVQKSH